VEAGNFLVRELEIKWNKDEILQELENYPERFSGNVILRGAFQETILPNIAFIGGGGEIAYWLELKEVFEKVQVPYPMLIVRNSFLLITEAVNQLIIKLQLTDNDIFKPELDLTNAFVKKHSDKQLSLAAEMQELNEFYGRLSSIAQHVDSTLQGHVQSLQTRSLKKLQVLEKKILKAEKRKFSTASAQVKKIKDSIFPNNSLQERTENFSAWYATQGRTLLDNIADNSPTLEQSFTILRW
jgi:uncharacterized protein YllA (UPF0747 family)